MHYSYAKFGTFFAPPGISFMYVASLTKMVRRYWFKFSHVLCAITCLWT